MGRGFTERVGFFVRSPSRRAANSNLREILGHLEPGLIFRRDRRLKVEALVRNWMVKRQSPCMQHQAPDAFGVFTRFSINRIA